MYLLRILPYRIELPRPQGIRLRGYHPSHEPEDYAEWTLELMGDIGQEFGLHLHGLQRTDPLLVLCPQLLPHPHVIEDPGTQPGKHQEIQDIGEGCGIPDRTHSHRQGERGRRHPAVSRGNGHLETVFPRRDIYENGPGIRRHLPSVVQPGHPVGEPPRPPGEIEGRILHGEGVLVMPEGYPCVQGPAVREDDIAVVFASDLHILVVEDEGRHRHIRRAFRSRDIIRVHLEPAVGGTEKHRASGRRKAAEKRDIPERAMRPGPS